MLFVTNDNEAATTTNTDGAATTNEQSELPGGIIGFSLDYTQISC